MGEASRAVVVTKLQMVFASFPLKTISWLIIRGVLLTRLAVKNSVRTQGYSPGPVTPFVLLDCFNFLCRSHFVQVMWNVFQCGCNSIDSLRRDVIDVTN